MRANSSSLASVCASDGERRAEGQAKGVLGNCAVGAGAQVRTYCPRWRLRGQLQRKQISWQAQKYRGETTLTPT